MSREKPTKILVAVSGMSPQIITETLYGLAFQQSGAWIPDEIHLITTREGRNNADLQLLHNGGYFHRLLKDYDITQSILFDDTTIHVIRSDDGVELNDLRSPEDNEAAANCICETIRELSARQNTELHVSLAGGRKTMGFYAGYALSLFGRPQDRLSHVLVSPEYESLRDFFYPTPDKGIIYGRDERPLDPSQAQVWMALIPFVRLRSFLPNDALLSRASFSHVVGLVDVLAGNPDIVISLSERRIKIGSIAIPLKPRELALYLVFVRALLKGEPLLKVPKSGSVTLGEAYLAEMQTIKGEMSDLAQTEKALVNGMDGDYFASVKSKLHATFNQILGDHGAKKYQIQSGSKGSYSFFLSLDPTQVFIE